MIPLVTACAFVTATIGGLAVVNVNVANKEAHDQKVHDKRMFDALLAIHRTLDAPPTAVRLTLMEGKVVTGVIVSTEEIQKIVYLDTRKPGIDAPPKFGDLLALAMNEIQQLHCDVEIAYGEGA